MCPACKRVTWNDDQDQHIASSIPVTSTTIASKPSHQVKHTDTSDKPIVAGTDDLDLFDDGAEIHEPTIDTTVDWGS